MNFIEGNMSHFAQVINGIALRGTYAGIGYTYDPVADVFIAPPAPSEVKPT
jgi:hypothetical protein